MPTTITAKDTMKADLAQALEDNSISNAEAKKLLADFVKLRPQDRDTFLQTFASLLPVVMQPIFLMKDMALDLAGAAAKRRHEWKDALKGRSEGDPAVKLDEMYQGVMIDGKVSPGELEKMLEQFRHLKPADRKLFLNTVVKGMDPTSAIQFTVTEMALDAAKAAKDAKAKKEEETRAWLTTNGSTAKNNIDAALEDALADGKITAAEAQSMSKPFCHLSAAERKSFLKTFDKYCDGGAKLVFATMEAMADAQTAVHDANAKKINDW